MAERSRALDIHLSRMAERSRALDIHLSRMAERSRALDILSKVVLGVGSNPAGDIYIFILHFRSLRVPHSSVKSEQMNSSVTFI